LSEHRDGERPPESYPLLSSYPSSVCFGHVLHSDKTSKNQIKFTKDILVTQIPAIVLRKIVVFLFIKKQCYESHFSKI
jgi:hypothetical protein